MAEAVNQIMALAGRTHAAGNKLIFVGNGGSSAIASHMATDYSKNGDVRAMALNDTAMLTCLGNDLGYDRIFAKQIELYARAGDLVLSVTVRKHPVFERDGLNLRVDVPVTFVEATLGATVEVPTLGGEPVRLRVAAGTPSGRVLRVKGRGVVTPKGTGDLLATVHVAVPSHLTDAARKHLEAFADAMPKENPRADLLEQAGGLR